MIIITIAKFQPFAVRLGSMVGQAGSTPNEHMSNITGTAF